MRTTLNINDDVARAEAYRGTELEINTISLEYRNSDVTYSLYQNEPSEQPQKLNCPK